VSCLVVGNACAPSAPALTKDCWPGTGPLGTDQDFQLPNGGSNRGQGPTATLDRVRINGLGQLDGRSDPLQPPPSGLRNRTRMPQTRHRVHGSLLAYGRFRRRPGRLRVQCIACFAGWDDHSESSAVGCGCTGSTARDRRRFPRLCGDVPNGIADASYIIVLPPSAWRNDGRRISGRSARRRRLSRRGPVLRIGEAFVAEVLAAARRRARTPER